MQGIEYIDCISVHIVEELTVLLVIPETNSNSNNIVQFPITTLQKTPRTLHFSKQPDTPH